MMLPRVLGVCRAEVKKGLYMSRPGVSPNTTHMVPQPFPT
jgi:hypothetical protein